jgi:membrane protease YdiL (CAAX protease family)
MTSTLRRWLWDQWKIIHEESFDPPGKGKPQKPALDWRPLVILLTVAVSLTLQEYWGERSQFAVWFPPAADAFRWDGQSRWILTSFVWWSGWRFFGYLVLPMIVLLFIRGERIRDYGLSLKGFSKHVWIYVVLYLAILPVVYLVSHTEPFQRTYPFYKFAHRSTLEFLAWEGLYALQFLSLEFFFRGFMLHGLRRHIGAHAIWVMVVPYCMIHYGKPMAETMGAIVAGLILGTLALRTRSIWCGVLIHITVAVTMDLLALSHCNQGVPCRGH